METKSVQTREGLDAAKAFDTEVRFLLTITREEMLRREAAYKAHAEQNPRKRGPKRKVKPSTSPDPDV